jgi:4-alpha-glucanotransferase
MSTLILGIHNHQPVGNFDHVIRDAQERAYSPFLDVLEKHPGIRMSVHTSGPLFEWQKREAPEYLERLGALVRTGQVETVGGGYWEPILTVLPERDQHAQIERMCRELEQYFGKRPRGLWLAERIWEPHLPRILAEHGLEYVALDDSHFLSTGFTEDDLRGYYLTEEGGVSLAVFPISFALRYLVPFHPVEKVLATLRESGAGEMSLLMDDGEKFGVWSSTHELCYQEGYLTRLFKALEAEPDLELGSFSDYLDGNSPLGIAYLPTASYSEMGEWALPEGAQRQIGELSTLVKGTDPALSHFVRGGFWRNFFVKYEESNWMHKRVLWLGRQIERSRREGLVPEADLQMAEEFKLEAQCNCAYWHGLFGGLYLPHLRHAIYERILKGEVACLPPRFTLEQEDLDFDGEREIIWSTPEVRLIIKPGSGGRIRELDWLPAAFSLTNTLTRRPEIYHADVGEPESGGQGEDDGQVAKSIHDIHVAKEEGLQNYLVYDPHSRGSLEERLYNESSPEAPAGYTDSWFDFTEIPFRVELPDNPEGVLRLSAKKEFEPGRWLTLDKKLHWRDDGRSLHVLLQLGYRGEGNLDTRFASGWNLNFLAPEAHDRLVLVDDKPAREPQLRSRGWERGACSLGLRDEWSGVAVTLRGENLDFYREPIETVSLSEAGFERVYQGSWIAVSRMVSLVSGGTTELEYCVELNSPAS